MQKIVNSIKRSGCRTKCALLAFVILNCFAVIAWILNPDMWATIPGNNWWVVVAQLTLGFEAVLLPLVLVLGGMFIAINSD